MKKVGIFLEWERSEGNLKETTLNMITMVRQNHLKLYGLLFHQGYKEEEQALIQKKLSQIGIEKIILIDIGADYQHPFCSAYALSEIIKKFEITAIVALSVGKNKTILPILAAELNVPLFMRCRSVDLETQIVEKPFYGEKFIAKIKVKGSVVIYGVHSSVVKMASMSEEITVPGEIIHETVKITEDKRMHCSYRGVKKNTDQSNLKRLTEAEIVLAGGRGLKNKENFELLYACAKELNAAVGASRVAVDQHWVDYSQQIGQTGFKISPEVYLGCGISGSLQHVLGMKTSKMIVTVNTDPKAALVSISDYYLNEDLFKIIPLLTQKLKERK